MHLQQKPVSIPLRPRWECSCLVSVDRRDEPGVGQTAGQETSGWSRCPTQTLRAQHDTLRVKCAMWVERRWESVQKVVLLRRRRIQDLPMPWAAAFQWRGRLRHYSLRLQRLGGTEQLFGSSSQCQAQCGCESCPSTAHPQERPLYCIDHGESILLRVRLL